MKLIVDKDGYDLEFTEDDESHIWKVLNEYRQYRLTSTDGVREIERLFYSLLNNEPNPTEQLMLRAENLSRIKSETYNNKNRYKD